MRYFISKRTKKLHLNIAKELVSMLKKHGYPCYIINKAQTGSVYLKFRDQRMGSIRVGDHEGYKKYRYVFNVRHDISRSYKEYDRGVARYYVPFSNLGVIKGYVEERFDKVKSYRKVKSNKVNKRKEKHSSRKWSPGGQSSEDFCTLNC